MASADRQTIHRGTDGRGTIFDSLTLKDLRSRTSRKWTLYPESVLPLFVAEMDAPADPAVTKEMGRLARSGDLGYLSPRDGQTYLDAYARFAWRRWGARVNVQEARVFADPISALRAVIVRTLGQRVQLDPSITNQGRRARYEGTVVTMTPVYPQFLNRLSAQYELKTVPYLPSHRPDFDGLERVFRQLAARGTRAPSPSGYDIVFLLCSPNNPTGTLFTREELIRLSLLCEKWNVRLLVDELHAPLERLSPERLEDARDEGFGSPEAAGRPDSSDGILGSRTDGDAAAEEEEAAERVRLSLLNEPGMMGMGEEIALDAAAHRPATPYRFVPILSLPQAQSAIAVFSGSKAFSIPSLRSCLLMAGDDPRCQDLIHTLTRREVEEGSHLDALVNAAALEHSDGWLDEVNVGLEQNAQRLREAIAERIPRARVVLGPATYLAWVDLSSYFSHTDMDGRAAEALMENAHVAFTPGEGFGGREWGNWVRINFATSSEVIDGAVDRAARYLSRL